jgi:hypothetical protein
VASPFQAQSEISPGKNIDRPARPPNLRRLSLAHESFAVIGPLAQLGSASYPVPVRRPAASLPASFTPSVLAVRRSALRFAGL